MTMVKAHLLDRPETEQTIDSEKGCSACLYVHEYGSGPGDYYVVVENVLSRVIQVDDGGQLILCGPVTYEDARLMIYGPNSFK